MEASIVVGLQFGDEGKGMSTDYLCSLYPKDTTVVVRFSGGQQAGHTVIHNGIKHIHSNFGSGTLRGVPSYFSEHCCIYLNTIDKEKSVLKEKGVEPKLTVHPLAKLTTPYDVAYNRIIEKINNHGSCGLGVGTTMKRHNETGYKLYVIDLIYPKLLLQKLENIKNYYKSKFPNELYRKEFIGEYLQYEHIFHELIFHYTELFSIEDYSHLIFTYENIIFEGSQGIMLDMDHGIFPNVTYANTTSKNAIEICHKIGVDDIQLHYITRCYQTRHGEGWMSNKDEIKLINNSEEINKFNDWQKEFKIGELDYELLNYALSVDDVYVSDFEGGTKRNLVVTCLDQRPDFKWDIDKLKYKFNSIRNVSSPNS